MHFIDESVVEFRAGDGGNGAISFHREKFVPKGGPDGGDGGDGGSVILVANRHLATLLDFRYKQKYAAKAGDKGQKSNRTGKRGEDLRIGVPCGTLIVDDESGKTLADLTTDGEEWCVAKGGKAGRGNAAFATPWNQTPRTAEPGTPGEERRARLELKLLADVGLVGLPNAGKSTLIAAISAARPKIADYPFTTLIPNLGLVRYSEYRSFVVADIPGLIEGAHSGKGLGIQFLKHIERTKLLVILLDSSSPNPAADLAVLERELKAHSDLLKNKPRVITFSKIDLVPPDERRARRFTLKGIRGTMKFSAVSREGLKDLLDRIWKELSAP
jgi:GTP-binding protein